MTASTPRSQRFSYHHSQAQAPNMSQSARCRALLIAADALLQSKMAEYRHAMRIRSHLRAKLELLMTLEGGGDTLSSSGSSSEPSPLGTTTALCRCNSMRQCEGDSVETAAGKLLHDLARRTVTVRMTWSPRASTHPVLDLTKWAVAFDALPATLDLYGEELLIRTAEMSVGDEVHLYKGFLARWVRHAPVMCACMHSGTREWCKVPSRVGNHACHACIHCSSRMHACHACMQSGVQNLPKGSLGGPALPLGHAACMQHAWGHAWGHGSTWGDMECGTGMRQRSFAKVFRHRVHATLTRGDFALSRASSPYLSPPPPRCSVHDKIVHVESHGSHSPMYGELAEAAYKYCNWFSLRTLTRT